MGEVYRARDTRLDRTVAIKVLPAHLATSPERRQRFEREAKAISALTHPHICVLHDVGQHDGVAFLVMECLEGETLADRLKKGALPLEQVLRYGIEISGALDMAHRHGIIHRDLKPGNVMLTKSGAKLLDFGLAKLRPPDAPMSALSELSALATGEKPLTAEGSIVGTFQYMAPEQLEGKEPDARADIFAFGGVLYEMATGQRAFKGKSQASLIAAILGSEPPPISRFQPLTPPALDRVVAACLVKDPDERWQGARDLLKELKWIQKAGSREEGWPVGPRGVRRERAAWAVAAMAVGVLGLYFWRDSTREPPRTVQAALLPPANATFDFFYGGVPALSPDGRRIAFVARSEDGRNRLWVRPLDGSTGQVLPGTEGVNHPFWSADSRALGFFADGRLKRIDASGGPAQTLCDASAGRGGTWSRDGMIVFSGQTNRGLSKIAATGGAPSPVTELDAARHETSHRWPSFLPDGRHFLYTALGSPSAAAVDAVFVGVLGSNKTERIVDVRSNARYAPPGYLLFASEGALVAQPFDATRQKLTGDAIPLADQVFQTFSPLADLAFSVSENGLLAYQAGVLLEPSQFVWFDRTGKQSETRIPAGLIHSPRLSHDGRRVAYRLEDRAGRGDLWIFDLGRQVASRFTFDRADDFDPLWSPDDARIVFSSNRSGGGDLYLKAASGAGAEELLLPSPFRKGASDWSRDGKLVLFHETGASTRYDLWSVSPADRKATVVLQTEFSESNAQISPDGRWVAYNSDESGRPEVYVQPFPGPGPKSRISREGGSWPRWRGDGKELFFVLDDRAIMAVDVKTSDTFSAGEPRRLFGARLKRSAPIARNYEVTPDGQRFLVNVTSSNETVPTITLVQNWTTALKR
jgi:Tol biopolymer transport system component